MREGVAAAVYPDGSGFDVVVVRAAGHARWGRWCCLGPGLGMATQGRSSPVHMQVGSQRVMRMPRTIGKANHPPLRMRVGTLLVELISRTTVRRIWHLARMHRLPGFQGPFPPPLAMSSRLLLCHRDDTRVTKLRQLSDVKQVAIECRAMRGVDDRSANLSIAHAPCPVIPNGVRNPCAKRDRPEADARPSS
jgi:hypothetical protein